jgi:hypothetical protein
MVMMLVPYDRYKIYSIIKFFFTLGDNLDVIDSYFGNITTINLLEILKVSKWNLTR